jgi:hypothetical protein
LRLVNVGAVKLRRNVQTTSRHGRLLYDLSLVKGDFSLGGYACASLIRHREIAHWEDLELIEIVLPGTFGTVTKSS